MTDLRVLPPPSTGNTPEPILPKAAWSRSVTDAACAVLAVVATVVSASAALRVAVPVESDLGFVAMLPAAYWVGPIALNIIFAERLSRAGRPRWLDPLLLGCLVFVLYAPAALASGEPRSEVTWRHVGVMDTIVRDGTINPGIDAYFNWPGFFSLFGFVLQATGMSQWTFALWAPVGNMVLWLTALMVLVRTLTRDRRLQWLTLWLFTLSNWIDQDYLSPQAFAYFLYLVILIVLLSWLRAEPQLRLRAEVAAAGMRTGIRRWWASRTPGEPDPRLRTAGLLIVVLLGSAMVISHQLTPFAVILLVAMLVLTGRCWAPGLPLILMVIVGLWLTYGASGYLAGHPVLVADAAVASLKASLADRLDGGAEHLFVIGVRMALTLAIWTMAAIGARRWLRHERDIRPILLAAVPLIMLPTQSYGGEMLLRVTLFGLPFTAFLAANAFIRRDRPRPSRGIGRVVAVVLVGAVLAVSMITARFGNARFDTFAKSEIEAAEAMYRLAPPHATLVAGAHPTAWRYQQYARKYITVQDECEFGDSAARCLSRLEARINHYGNGAAILLNRANRESLRLQGMMRPETFDQLEALLRHRSGVAVVYEDEYNRVYLMPPRRPRT